MIKAKQHPIKNLYFSKRIIEAMDGIWRYPLTIIEAPMGYGKTTAVKEFVSDTQAQVLWQTVSSETPEIFWRDFVRLFASIDENGAHGLMELGFPNDDILLQEAVRIISDAAFPDRTFWVIDDYHLLVSPQADRLIERLAVSDIVGVHMVVITRYNGKLNSEELGLKGYLHSIVKEEFELKPRDIAEYYKTCGINVNDAEIGRLYALTEGWISALYLFMLEYIATGSYSPETNLYSLVEKTVYEPLASEKKDFLLTLSLFDNFTQEQAEYLWGEENAGELLAEITSQNAFVSYNRRNKTYFVHNILSGFLCEKLAELPSSRRRSLYLKAAGWLCKTGDYFAAMRYYYECGDFDQCLLTLESDRSHDFTAVKKEIIKKYMAECPAEIKAKHSYAALKFLLYLFIHNEIALFGQACKEFIDNIHADTALKSEARSRLLGEFELILGFTAYNDIKKMAEHYTKSWVLIGQPTAIYDPKLNWTFGSPSVLYLYYRESGRLAEHTRDLIEHMPCYSRLTSGHGSGGEYIMEGERLYHLGDFAEAEVTAYKARYKAQTDDQPNIVFCADYLLMRLAFLRGDSDRLFDLLRKMREEMISKKAYQLIHLVEICENSVYAALKQKNKLTAGLMAADPKALRLGFPGFGAFNIFYGRALLISGEYLKLIGSAEYFFGIASVFSNLLGKIYTHIYLAAANHRLFRKAAALDHLNQALSMALPDKLFMPFAENGDYIQPLLEHFYNEGHNRSDLVKILEFCAVYEHAAEQIVRESFTTEKPKLTDRELEIAQFAAEGITNKEIGARLFISENTVKMALKSVFEKLNISSRALLKQSLHRLNS